MAHRKECPCTECVDERTYHPLYLERLGWERGDSIILASLIIAMSEDHQDRDETRERLLRWADLKAGLS